MQLADDHPASFYRYYRAADRHRGAVDKEATQSKIRQVEVLLFMGPPGTGKSYWARQAGLSGGGSVYRKLEEMGNWWDGYEGESTIIIDDLNELWIKHSTLLGMMEGHFAQVQVKGGMKVAKWTRMILTTNLNLSEDQEGRGSLRSLMGQVQFNAFYRRLSAIFAFRKVDDVDTGGVMTQKMLHAHRPNWDAGESKKGVWEDLALLPAADIPMDINDVQEINYL